MFTGQKTVPLIKTLVLNLYANLYSGSRRLTPPPNLNLYATTGLLVDLLNYELLTELLNILFLFKEAG